MLRILTRNSRGLVSFDGKRIPHFLWIPKYIPMHPWCLQKFRNQNNFKTLSFKVLLWFKDISTSENFEKKKKKIDNLLASVGLGPKE